jgi:hypothetical protein
MQELEVAAGCGPREGRAVEPERAYRLRDVLAYGFEAQCQGSNGVRYYWHRRFGVRIDTRSGKSVLLTDPGSLPDAPWFPTSVGLNELKAALAAEEEGAGAGPA